MTPPVRLPPRLVNLAGRLCIRFYADDGAFHDQPISDATALGLAADLAAAVQSRICRVMGARR